MEFLIFIVVVFCGWAFGSHTEKKHYKSIQQREIRYMKKPVISFEKNVSMKNAEASKLVTGSCVISIDAFKKLIAGFANLIGGNVVSYESLVDRARREAILRMIQHSNGYNMIINTKIETTTVGRSDDNGKKSASAVSVLVYGTAIKTAKKK